MLPLVRHLTTKMNNKQEDLPIQGETWTNIQLSVSYNNSSYVCSLLWSIDQRKMQQSSAQKHKALNMCKMHIQGVRKKQPPLKLCGIFSLRLSLFAWNFANLLAVHTKFGRYVWIWTANKSAKFHTKRLNQSKNVPKSFRGLLFLKHPVHVYWVNS